MSIDDAIGGLKTILTTALSGTTIGGRIYAYTPDEAEPPFIVVLPGPGDFLLFDRTFEGSTDFSLQAKVIVGTQDDRTGQAELLSYMDVSGSTSLYAAVAAAPTLNSTVSFVTGLRWGNYGDVEWAGVTYLGAELNVDCGT